MSAVSESLDELLRLANHSEEDGNHSRNDLGVDGEDGEEGNRSSLESQQALICQDIIESLQQLEEEHRAKASRSSMHASSPATASDSEESAPQAHNFIHTSIDYNNKQEAKPKNTKAFSSSVPSKFLRPKNIAKMLAPKCMKGSAKMWYILDILKYKNRLKTAP